MSDSYVDLFLYVNEHREACGRPTFKELTESEIERHIALIEAHAPYSNDPWDGEDSK
jgi:hypothetical protein